MPNESAQEYKEKLQEYWRQYYAALGMDSERRKTYNTVVVMLGYGGYLAILNAVSNKVENIYILASSLLMLTSGTIFVVYQLTVFKRDNEFFFFREKMLGEVITKTYDWKNYADLRDCINSKRAEVDGANKKWDACCYYPSLIFGILSAALLFVGIAKALFK
jgi:hypothetical protein